MKVRVISPFVDRFDNTVKYTVGMVVDFESDRANNMIARNLAVALESEQPIEKPQVRKRKGKKNNDNS